MKGLTKKQRQVLSFISEYVHRNGYSPSFREIQGFFNFASLGSVAKYITILCRKGLLTYEKGRGRSLLPIAKEGRDLFRIDEEIPLIGNISADCGIETFSQTQTLHVPKFLLRSPDITYILRARGDSLSEEFIIDSDLLIVEARSEAYPMELIVGLINDRRLIVRKYSPEGNYVRLISLSCNAESIVVKGDELIIHGVVTGMLRLYS